MIKNLNFLLNMNKYTESVRLNHGKMTLSFITLIAFILQLFKQNIQKETLAVNV